MAEHLADCLTMSDEPHLLASGFDCLQAEISGTDLEDWLDGRSPGAGVWRDHDTRQI